MVAYARPTTNNAGKKTRFFMGGLLVPKRVEIQYVNLRCQTALPDSQGTRRDADQSPGKRKQQRPCLLQGFVSAGYLSVFNCTTRPTKIIQTHKTGFAGQSGWSAFSGCDRQHGCSDAWRHVSRVARPIAHVYLLSGEILIHDVRKVHLCES